MEPVAPILTAHLYAPLHDELITLLGGLAPADWRRPTVCPGWMVRDLVAHLLEVDLRRLSLVRDRLEMAPPDPPIRSYHDLVDFLNRLNADWIRAAQRLSPRVMLDLLAVTGPQVAEHVASLDMDTPSRFAVSWAGDDVSPNWFDVGRDYTERWHHQQQIRDAVGARGLTDREWLFPVLDLFMRSAPFTYRDTPAPAGAAIEFHIEGDAGGVWTLVRGSDWELFRGPVDRPVCTIRLGQDAAWRMFTKGIGREEAVRRARIEGEAALAAPFLGSLAVMA
jgi:uncharacterized protein (TIGR03083 family)